MSSRMRAAARGGWIFLSSVSICKTVRTGAARMIRSDWATRPARSAAIHPRRIFPARIQRSLDWNLIRSGGGTCLPVRAPTIRPSNPDRRCRPSALLIVEPSPMVKSSSFRLKHKPFLPNRKGLPGVIVRYSGGYRGIIPNLPAACPAFSSNNIGNCGACPAISSGNNGLVGHAEQLLEIALRDTVQSAPLSGNDPKEESGAD